MRITERLPGERGRDYALRMLRDNIVTADLAPGSVVSENELAQQLKLSRTPVREAIIDNIEEFDGILSDPALVRDFPGWCGRSLKTMPQGWPKDHPRAELLRLLEYGKFHTVDRGFFTDPAWPERAAELFRPAKAFNDFINYSIDE